MSSPHARHVALKLLQRREKTDDYIDRLMESEFRKNRLPEREKNLIHELVNGTIRWLGHLNWIIGQLYQGKLEKSPYFVRSILQLSLYQLIFLDKIPAYAVLNEAGVMAKKMGGDYWAGKINAILRTYLKTSDRIVLPDREKDPVESITIRYSHPSWMVRRWIDRYGIQETEMLCHANNQIPRLSLRLNRLKMTPEQVKERLTERQIDFDASGELEEFVTAARLPELSDFDLFQEGFFSIQDESAGLVAHLVDPKPGETIIDLCAAPGGKTAHLAELGKNEVSIIAVDRNHHRLSLVRDTVMRLGLKSVQLICADASELSLRKADKVLIDAPCSGLGVLAKRSDLRWKRTPDHIKELVSIQKAILDNACSLLKENGALIYSTCTIEPEENETVIAGFLHNHPDFIIDDASKYIPERFVQPNHQVYTYPHRHRTDGSFAVRLVRKFN